MSYRFPVPLYPNVGESLFGFVSRLAMTYGWENGSSLLNALGVTNTAQMNWNVESDKSDKIINMLAGSLGIDINTLRETLFPNQVTGIFSVYTGLPSSQTSKPLKICPVCIKENGTHKLIWQHRCHGVCAKHQCQLVEQCQSCGTRVNIAFQGDCHACLRSLVKLEDTCTDITPLILCLENSTAKRLLEALEIVVAFLACGGDTYSVAGYLKGIPPVKSARIFQQALLILINESHLAAWNLFITNKREHLSLLGQSAIVLPILRLPTLSRTILTDVMQGLEETQLTHILTCLPDFSLYEEDASCLASHEDIQRVSGFTSNEVDTLVRKKWLVPVNQTKQKIRERYSLTAFANKINVKKPLQVPTTELLLLSAPDLNRLKYVGLNKADVLIKLSVLNRLYTQNNQEEKIANQLILMKSDLATFFQQQVVIETHFIGIANLSQLMGISIRKLKQLNDEGYIQLRGDQIDVQSVNKFFAHYDVLNRLGNIANMNVETLHNTLIKQFNIYPEKSFQSITRGNVYLYKKTASFNNALSHL